MPSISQLEVNDAYEWHGAASALLAQGAQLGAMLRLPHGPVAALFWKQDAPLWLAWMPGPDDTYPSLTARFAQAQFFERELWEEHGLVPSDHPWLKPLRRHADLEEPGQAYGWQGPAQAHPFYRVEGPGVHEVAVGPVHAGIIEPGHFRFQCEGEQVLHLEIQLGYQFRGAENLLLSSSYARRLAIVESLAGDTVAGHAWAGCRVLESLADTEVPPRGDALRGVALEMERIASHVGDLGALCNDIGYLPGASWFGRLRGDFLNLLVELTGNRMGRGFFVPGGVRGDIGDAEVARWLEILGRAEEELERLARMTFEEPSVQGRFEQTGVLTREVAVRLGVVGLAARASGVEVDARISRMGGVYSQFPISVVVAQAGDVAARAWVRWEEIRASLAWLKTLLPALPGGATRGNFSGVLAPETIGLGVVEGWRGEIVHVLATDKKGQLSVVKMLDPSVHNWFGLAKAMRGQQISDFPLCNKSFNLSYAGYDG